jgi:hypothetical protein
MCDDMIIMNLKALEEALEQFNSTAQEIGLIIKKKQNMTVSKKTHNQCKHIAGG